MEQYSAPRRFGGVSLRGIAWVALASWLFSLVVCSVSAIEFGETPTHHSESATPLGLDDHSKNGGQQEEACCRVLQNLPSASQATNSQMLLHSLAYILLPYIAVVCAVLFAPTVVRYFGTDPPGKSNHALIANSLWPNAPPR